MSRAGDHEMIYRSRYLNRLQFLPLGRRRDVQPPVRLQERHDTVGVGVASEQGGLGERAPYLSSRELRDIVGRCERSITAGRAQIEDFEAFIICQQELKSR